MSALTATVANGQLVSDEPIDWPDGQRVEVVACTGPTTVDLDPEAWIAWYETLEPVEFTDEERAALAAERQRNRTWELAQWDAPQSARNAGRP